jgi:mannose-6-phosphate isomerase
MTLYPLKFSPVFCYRIWGGEKLKTVLNKKYEEDSIGESWEISDVDNFETIVSEGNLKGAKLKDLIKQYKGDFVGESVYKQFGDEFPLLIKFIDAKTPLSIQVHPDDALAKERHNSFGKNEMWIVMESDDDAELTVGFNQKINKEDYFNHIEKSSLTTVLNTEKVKKGDVFYIPAGRVHAIGAGVLLAEIQQTSNITYRIYDYNRVDPQTGQQRELHTELALDAINFDLIDHYKTNYNLNINESNILVHSPFFTTNIIKVEGSMLRDYSSIDSFVIYICLSGSAKIAINDSLYYLQKGETMLLPATIKKTEIQSNGAEIIEVYMF